MPLLASSLAFALIAPAPASDSVVPSAPPAASAVAPASASTGGPPPLPAAPDAAPPSGPPPLEPAAAAAPEAALTAPAPVATNVPAEAVAPPMDPTVTAPALPAAPRPLVAVPPPPKSGRGLMIAGGVVMGTGLILKILTTSAVVQTARAYRGDGDGFPSFEIDAMVLGGSLFYKPLIGGGMGLMAGGFVRRGQLAAHQDIFSTTSKTRRPRQAALGWGLFGGGAGLWAVTRLAGLLGCQTSQCKAGVYEGGYYASLAMTSVGLPLGAWSTSYENYEARWAPVVARSLSVAPMGGAGRFGLSLIGRF